MTLDWLSSQNTSYAPSEPPESMIFGKPIGHYTQMIKGLILSLLDDEDIKNGITKLFAAGFEKAVKNDIKELTKEVALLKKQCESTQRGLTVLTEISEKRER